MTTLPPTDYAALVAAIDTTCGACTCGPLARRGLGWRCLTCCQKDGLLLELLAARDTSGRATVERWTAWKHYPQLLQMLEPLR